MEEEEEEEEEAEIRAMRQRTGSDQAAIRAATGQRVPIPTLAWSAATSAAWRAVLSEDTAAACAAAVATSALALPSSCATKACSAAATADAAKEPGESDASAAKACGVAKGKKGGDHGRKGG